MHPDSDPGLFSRALGIARRYRRRLTSFAIIGAICTVVFAATFAAWRTQLSPLGANAAAMSMTVSLNFVANRWLTFRAQRRSLRAEVVQYAAVYLLGVALSSVALRVALGIWNPDRLMETVVAVACGGFATVTRFALLTAWVFPDRERVPFEGRAIAAEE